jgi:hypothetical protein
MSDELSEDVTPAEPTPAEPATPPAGLLNAEPPTPPAEGDPAPPADPIAPVAYESRPDWLAEKFWDPDKKEIRVDAAMKSYADTQKELHRYQNQRGPGVPAEATGYASSEAIVDGNFTFGEEHVELPPLAAEDPLLLAFNQAAFEQGLSVKVHDAIVRKIYPTIVEIQRPTISIEDELIKLGNGDLDNGSKLHGIANTWIENMQTRGQINENQATMIKSWGANAVSIETLLKLREGMGEKPIPPGAPIEMEGVPTAQELQAMVNDERYNKDAAYRAEVQKAHERAEPLDPKVEGPVFTS